MNSANADLLMSFPSPIKNPLRRMAGLALLAILAAWATPLRAQTNICDNWSRVRPYGVSIYSPATTTTPNRDSGRAYPGMAAYLIPNTLSDGEALAVNSISFTNRWGAIEGFFASFDFYLGGGYDGGHDAGLNFNYGPNPGTNNTLVAFIVSDNQSSRGDSLIINYKGVTVVNVKRSDTAYQYFQLFNDCPSYNLSIAVTKAGVMTWSVFCRDSDCNPISQYGGTVALSGWVPTVNDGFAWGAFSYTFDQAVGINNVKLLGYISPVLDPVPSAVTVYHSQTGTIPVTIVSRDPSVSAGAVNLTASAADKSLIPDANIQITGSGASRTVVFTSVPAVTGQTAMNISISSPGLTNEQNAYSIPITILPDVPPSLSPPPSVTVQQGQTVSLPFTFGSVSAVLSSIALTAQELPSGNGSGPLIQTNTLFVIASNPPATTGSANGAVLLTPRLDHVGSGTVQLTARDGYGLQSSATFTLTVVPATNGPVTLGASTALSFNENGATGQSAVDSARGDLGLGGQFTIEAWVRPSAYVAQYVDYNPIVAFGRHDGTTNTANFAMLAVKNDGVPAFAGNYNNALPTSGVTVPTNVWTHLAVVVNGQGVLFYINGAVVNASALPVAENVLDGPLCVGFDPANINFFQGQIAEVRVWNLARQTADIQRDYRTPLNGNERGLVRYYGFGQGYYNFDFPASVGALNPINPANPLPLNGFPSFVPGPGWDTTVTVPENQSVRVPVVAAGYQGTNVFGSAGVERDIYLYYQESATNRGVGVLTNNVKFPNNPDVINVLGDALEVPPNGISYAGERLRGYLLPPKTGNYTFWISANNEAELWISSGENPAAAARVARSPGSGVGWHQWGVNPALQKSALIPLVAGQRYYFQVIHQAGAAASTGAAHVSVQWQLPDGTLESPLPAYRVQPVGQVPAGHNLQAVIASPPSMGVASIYNGVLTYTPAPNFYGSDSLMYYVTDGSMTSAVSRVVMQVPNQSPQPFGGTGNALSMNGGAQIQSGNPVPLAGGSFTVEAWARRAAKPGSALNFNGNNQYIVVTNFGNIAPTNEVTVEFWAKPRQYKQQSAFILNPDTPPNRFNGHVNYVGDLQSYFDFGNIGGNAGRLTTLSPPTNFWTHYTLVASQSGNYMSIYTNGVLAATKPGMTPFVRGTYDLNIGGNVLGNFDFDGLITDFRIWQRALSQGEVAASMSAQLTGKEPDLLLYYPMNEGAGNVSSNLAAITGAAYNGALVNGPLWTNDVPLSGQWLLSMGSAAPDQGLIFGWNSTNAFTFGFWNDDLATPVPYADTNWHHWAATFNATNLQRKIYLDTNLVAVGTASANLSLNSQARLFVGSLFGGAPFFQGGLSEVRIWNGVREAEDIIADQSVSLTGNEDNLLLYYRLNEGNGLAVYDSGPLQNNGSLSGVVTWSTNNTYFGTVIVPRNSPGQQIYLPAFAPTDPSGQNLSYNVSPRTAHGSVAHGDGPLVTYIPDANYYGPDQISYTVADGTNLSSQAVVRLQVAFVNIPPSLSSFLDQAVEEEDPPLALPFTVEDLDTPVNSLTFTADSSNPTLLSPGGITFAGSGTNRTVILNPTDGEIGQATVTITVSDGDLHASQSFKYEVKGRLAFAPIDLGVLTGQPYSIANGINASGQVVGFTATDGNESHPRGFFYTGFGPLATLLPMGTMGGDASRSTAVNGSGVTVGAGLDGSGSSSAFTALPTQTTNLSSLGLLVGGTFSAATAINDAGLVVGYGDVGGGSIRPFVGGIKPLTALDLPPGATNAFATAVNNRGIIVGYAVTLGQTNAFWFDTVSTNYYGTLATPGGYAGSVPTAINDLGEVGGYLITNNVAHAALAVAGSWTDLGGILGSGEARITGLNHFRQAVGTALSSNGVWHAFYYENGRGYDLNALVPADSGWTLNEARGINDQGEVVGWGQKDGQTRAFLLYPATEIGRRVFRPVGTLPTSPSIDFVQVTPGDENGTSQLFYWSAVDQKLFSTGPSVAVIHWHTGTYTTYTNTTQFGSQFIYQVFTNEVTKDTLCYSIWPANPDLQVASCPVDVEPQGVGFKYYCVGIAYSTIDGASISPSPKTFNAAAPGYSVIQYALNNGNPYNQAKQPVVFSVARTILWNDTNYLLSNLTATVGDALSYTNHDDYAGRNGYLLFTNAYYDGAGPDAAYNRTNRTGVILPVNSTSSRDDFVVAWYKRNRLGTAWPNQPAKYNLVWPTNAPHIVIASGLGTGPIDPALYPGAQIYNQPDPTLPGFNPNEEHALFAPAQGGGSAVFALRNDLNTAGRLTTSQPFVLLKYQDPAAQQWRIKCYQVVAQEAPYAFTYPGTAGSLISPPYPLSLLPLATNSVAVSGPSWRDYAGRYYALAAGEPFGQSAIVMHYFYPLQPGFWYDLNGNGTNDLGPGAAVPWLSYLNGATPNTPIDVNYQISWPADIPALSVGQTLSGAVNGLPDVQDMASAQVVYDSLAATAGQTGLPPYSELARLFDSMIARTVPVPASFTWPSSIQRAVDLTTQNDIFPDLPYYLRVRLFYDPVNHLLGFKGYTQSQAAGQPISLVNVMSSTERDRIQQLDPSGASGPFGTLIQQLYQLTRNPNQLDINPKDGVPDDALLIGLTLDAKGNVVPEQFTGESVSLTAGLQTYPGALPPKYGLSFDGTTNGSVELANAPYPNITNDFSMEFWARPTQARGQTAENNDSIYFTEVQKYAIVPIEGSDAYGANHLTAGISVGTNGVSIFEHGSYQLHATLVYEQPTFGWTHVAFVYQNRRPYLYLNGNLVHIGLETMTNWVLHPSAMIGGWNARPDLGHFAGTLDEVRIWDHALTQAEIASRMNSQLRGSESGLIGYWRLSEGAGTTVGDSSPGNRSQTLYGNAQWVTTDVPIDTAPKYMVLAENNDPSLAGLPVELHVIQVSGGPYTGTLQVIPPDNVLDQRVTVHHSPDFAGDPDQLQFEWFYHPADGGVPPPPDPNNPGASGWILFKSASGLNNVTVGEADVSPLLTLSDNWFVMRYRGYVVSGATNWSSWVGDTAGNPMLVEGWVNRVLNGINLFNQRNTDFSQYQVNTLISTLAEAGPRYEGDVALNPSALDTPGLIQIYQTVLNRAESLSINGTPPVDYPAADTAILDAAGHISDLYMLYGNEAFADAADPTIGVNPPLPTAGSLASSMFAFEDEVSSLLEEELCLLRGRDDTSANVTTAPVYNRLFWNFTGGNGEVAYTATYNMSDYNADGSIDANDAAILYPQGHGDAWGHYLTALTTYYSLLQNTNFTWTPQAESVTLGGVPIQVGYQHERKFAAAALALAQSGAEIVDRTYRWDYTDDPAPLWTGYADTNPDRAWGVKEWGWRAGQGAYFNWLTGNALLPANDTNHIGIQKIDRTTVPELTQIPAEAAQMQSVMDTVDQGYNPMGLSQNVVSFDLDPTTMLGTNQTRKTHFEQIYDRAVAALQNAVTTFGQASEVSDALRSQADNESNFGSAVMLQEGAYKGQLIQLFGYPYSGDIGPGTPNPAGYSGPDLYHWMYIDTTDVAAQEAPDTNLVAIYGTFRADATNYGFHFADDVLTDLGSGINATLSVNYPLSANGYLFQAPAAWGSRQAEGSLQTSLRNFVQAKAALLQASIAHQNQLNSIKGQLALLEQRYNLQAEQISIANTKIKTGIALDVALDGIQIVQNSVDTTVQLTSEVGKSIIDAIPKVEGLADDALSTLRGSLLAAQIGPQVANESVLKALAFASTVAQQSADTVNLELDIDATKAQQSFDLQQAISDLQSTVRSEVGLRLTMLQQEEAMVQAWQNLLATKSQAETVLLQRMTYRQLTAGSVAEMRYRDNAFRVFRSDALQRYDTQFQLAARYVYLAAKAFDYEINTPEAGAGDLAASVVNERSVGQMINGVPSAGRSGLASILARLKQNFDVLKPDLGLNNVQYENAQFSLRREWLRITNNTGWANTLQSALVTNLWTQVPEYRQYCRPFAPESVGAQPALVLSIPGTVVNPAQNFFGRPLAPMDYAYDPSEFSTRIYSVAIWFTGYDLTQLARSPRAYLVPVGDDILRSPDANNFTLRNWHIVEQKVPIPFPASGSTDSSWLTDTLSIADQFANESRHSALLAYPDNGYSDAAFATNTRLVGRSVANTRWLLIIPGAYLLGDSNQGLANFINSVSDIKLYFQTYSASGN